MYFEWLKIIMRYSAIYASITRCDVAQRSAMIYSLLGCCKINDVNPYEWLKDVLTKIQYQPINKIKDFLTNNWKPLLASSQ